MVMINTHVNPMKHSSHSTMKKMNMTIKKHSYQEDDTYNKIETIAAANNHQTGDNVDVQEEKTTYKKKDAVTNIKIDHTSTSYIKTGMAEKDPDVASDQKTSDNVIEMVNEKDVTRETTNQQLYETEMVENEPDVTSNIINHQAYDENTITADTEMDVANNTIDV